MDTNYAILDDTGLCVNVVAVDDSIAAPDPAWISLAEDTSGAWLGWTYSASTWTAPPDPDPAD